MKLKKFVLKAILGIVLMTFSGVPKMDAEAGNMVYEISEETFPDSNLRSYISKRIDNNQDGLLDASELDRVRDISCVYDGVSDLTGLEVFYNLESLNISYNLVADLDIGKYPKLKKLSASGCNISNIDFAKCQNLVEVDLSCNPLTTIDLSQNQKLESVTLVSCKLQSLDVSKNSLVRLNVGCNYDLKNISLGEQPQLMYLTANSCALEQFDPSGCPNLVELNLNGNKLTELNLSGCKELKELYCNDNQLERIELADCKNLNKLHCYSNKLKEIQLCDMDGIKEINCHSNKLREMNVANKKSLETLYCSWNEIELIDVSGCSSLKYLECQDNKIRELEVGSCDALQTLFCGDNALVCLDISNNKDLMSVICNNNVRYVHGYLEKENIPDNFDWSRVTKTNKNDPFNVKDNQDGIYTYSLDGRENGIAETFTIKKDNQGFDLKNDGWQIPNLHIGFGYPEGYQIPKERYEEQNIKYLKETWEGHCNGMSCIALLFYEYPELRQKYIGTKKLTEVGKLKQLEDTKEYYYSIEDEDDLIRLIENYNIWMNTKDYTKLTKKNRIEMKEVIRELQENKTPYLFGILYKTGTFKSNGHAVVINSSVAPVDLGCGWWRVSIYDPTNPYTSNCQYDFMDRYKYAQGCFLELNVETNQCRVTFGIGTKNRIYISEDMVERCWFIRSTEIPILE